MGVLLSLPLSDGSAWSKGERCADGSLCFKWRGLLHYVPPQCRRTGDSGNSILMTRRGLAG